MLQFYYAGDFIKSNILFLNNFNPNSRFVILISCLESRHQKEDFKSWKIYWEVLAVSCLRNHLDNSFFYLLNKYNAVKITRTPPTCQKLQTRSVIIWKAFVLCWITTTANFSWAAQTWCFTGHTGLFNWKNVLGCWFGLLCWICM